MEKLQLRILQYNRHKTYFGLLLFILISFGCSSSKKISNEEWKIEYGYFQGISYLICEKYPDKLLCQYKFETSRNLIEQRTSLGKSFERNGYKYFWLGVKDTSNLKLPRIVTPLKIQVYDYDEKAALGKVLLLTSLNIWKERRNYFDSLRYFILVDSIKLQPKY